MQAKTILKKLDRIDDLPTLPAIAMEVLLDYDTSINKLSDRIKSDQAMVSKILKLVNSAFFGLRSKIGNIPHAIVVLGFNTIRNAVLSVSMIDTFSIKEAFNGFDITEFWKHSVAVAVTSKYLADKAKINSADDCFVGGLLHDMGKVVLLQHFRELFQKVWSSVEENNLSFYEAEKSEISIDHARIGGRLAQKWQLPDRLVNTIRYHHTVKPSADDINPSIIVYIANAIVNTYVADSRDNLRLSEIHPEAIKVTGSQLDNVHDWYPELSHEIESGCKFFLEESKK